VFGDQAKPDHALKILELFLDHAEHIKTGRIESNKLDNDNE